MKKVINNLSDSTVDINLVNCDKYYLAVYNITTNNKSNKCEYEIITAKEFRSNLYDSLCLDEITKNNCRFRDLSLKDIIENYLRIGSLVYEFDSWQEMIKYLASQLRD